MVKKVTVLLCSVICLVVFGLTELGAKSREKIPIHLFIQMSPSEKENPNSAAYQLVNQYNQSKENIQLVLDITTASCSFDAADSLLKRIAQGNPPDISYLRYRELWDNYQDLTPYLTESFLNSMDTTMLQAFRINNRQVFLPTGYANRLFYYNKKLFDAAGLAYPPHQYGAAYADGEAWDIHKLEEIATLLTLDNQGRHAGDPEFDADHIIQYGFHWGWLNGIGMIQMFGPAQFITDNGEVTIPDHTRQGYQWVHDAIWQKHFAPDMTVFTDDMEGRPLRSGKCAMMLSYVDNARILQNTSTEWDIAAVPSCNGAYNIPWGIGGYAILETSPQEAMEVIMDIININDLYATPDMVIPMKKDIRANIINIWHPYYPDIDLQVILDGFNHGSALCDGQVLQFRMQAWKLVNDYRGYLWEESDTQMVTGAIDAWLIPEIEKVINTTNVNNRSLNTYPEQFQLFQNYPNPFNPDTQIEYQLDKADHLLLKVYNISGQEIDVLVDEFKSAGKHRLIWQPKNLASGIYLYSLEINGHLKMRKLIFTK